MSELPQYQLPQFRRPVLLEQAMIHRSYVNENPRVRVHNERLEFLGDAILNFLCGEFLYQRYPDLAEGKLTPMRSSLVDEKQLAQFALALDLGSQLRLGRGAERDGGRENPNLLSCAFEALVGAYYLDCDDIDAVREYVTAFFESVVVEVAEPAPEINHKSRFQHWALTEHGENPKYVIVAATGPDHEKEFVAEVQVLGKTYGQGQGRSKQVAEKEAARDALEELGIYG
ncbi:ribonuclease III [filamentous cyanobacterium LEGE 11480]|uniref:Ribonuclease 3 n=1 Tax=Romeriopsis navalis LEGE 11480 TaxID=2777977 RepID=A0A928VPD5_9CYAN|nr:ribonuclease III [Romeriopsis navalis]MBE9032241.1 ribonuclease III [Romeriopsis navalis LEGE 11480]